MAAMAATASWILALVLLDQRLVLARLGMSAVDLTRSAFDDFVNRNDKVLVDFYDRENEDWNKDKTELEAAVRQVRSYGCKVPIAKVDAKSEGELAKKFVPRGSYPQLLWFLHGQPTQYHRALRNSKAIADFVMALDRDPVQVIQKPEEVATYNRAILAEISKTSPFYPALEVVAAKHMDMLAVAFLESSKESITWHSEEGPRATYKGEASAKALESWVKGLMVKSEPLPEGYPAPVYDAGSLVVVSRSFEELVLRKDKDVMLLIYAPWCGFSKKFFSIWEAFAKVVSEQPHLVVAKMDGDRNGSPLPEEFSWPAYPTVLHVKAGQTWPTVFHGNRTVANLVRFASEHGSKPITLDPAVSTELEAEL